MLRFELAQLGFGVEAVNVEHKNAGHVPVAMATLYCGFCATSRIISGSVVASLKPFGRCRAFVARPARKNVQAARSECQCCSQHHGLEVPN